MGPGGYTVPFLCSPSCCHAVQSAFRRTFRRLSETVSASHVTCLPADFPSSQRYGITSTVKCLPADFPSSQRDGRCSWAGVRTEGQPAQLDEPGYEPRSNPHNLRPLGPVRAEGQPAQLDEPWNEPAHPLVDAQHHQARVEDGAPALAPTPASTGPKAHRYC